MSHWNPALACSISQRRPTVRVRLVVETTVTASACEREADFRPVPNMPNAPTS